MKNYWHDQPFGRPAFGCLIDLLSVDKQLKPQTEVVLSAQQTRIPTWCSTVLIDPANVKQAGDIPHLDVVSLNGTITAGDLFRKSQKYDLYMFAIPAEITTVTLLQAQRQCDDPGFRNTPITHENQGGQIYAVLVECPDYYNSFSELSLVVGGYVLRVTVHIREQRHRMFVGRPDSVAVDIELAGHVQALLDFDSTIE